MKIEMSQSFLQIGPSARSVQEIHGAEEDRNATGAAPLSGDTIVLSSRARRLIGAREAYDALPDVRDDKVAQLREQVANGTYQVNSKKVAWKMLQQSLLAEKGSV